MIEIKNRVTLKNYLLGHYYRMGLFFFLFIIFLICDAVYDFIFGSGIGKIWIVFFLVIAFITLFLPVVKYLLAKYLYKISEIVFQFDIDSFTATYGKVSMKTNISECKKILFHKKYLLIIGKLGQQPILFEDVAADDIKNQLMNSDFKDLVKLV